MTIDPTGAGASGLIDRVKNIITSPAAEWDRIAAEPADVNKLYIGYALPLVVVAAIAARIDQPSKWVPSPSPYSG